MCIAIACLQTIWLQQNNNQRVIFDLPKYDKESQRWCETRVTSPHSPVKSKIYFIFIFISENIKKLYLI